MKEYDDEIFDDGDFYRQMIQQLLEESGQGGTEAGGDSVGEATGEAFSLCWACLGQGMCVLKVAGLQH